MKFSLDANKCHRRNILKFPRKQKTNAFTWWNFDVTGDYFNKNTFDFFVSCLYFGKEGNQRNWSMEILMTFVMFHLMFVFFVLITYIVKAVFKCLLTGVKIFNALFKLIFWRKYIRFACVIIEMKRHLMVLFIFLSVL